MKLNAIRAIAFGAAGGALTWVITAYAVFSAVSAL